MGDHDGHTTTNKLGGKLCGTITTPLRVADFQRDVATLRITKALQAAPANGWGSEADTRTPTWGTLPACCENAGRRVHSNQATLLPKKLMKSRRRISAPRLKIE